MPFAYNKLQLIRENKIKEVSFEEKKLSREMLEQLANALISNTSVRKLSLGLDVDVKGDNPISSYFPDYLCHILENTKLEKLDLFNIPLSTNVVTRMAVKLQANQSLTALSIRNAGIERDAYKILTTALASHASIESVRFAESSVELSEVAEKSFATMLSKNRKIKSLSLKGLKMSQQGMDALLATQREEKSLKKLALITSELSLDTLSQLGDLLAAPDALLEKLDLSYSLPVTDPVNEEEQNKIEAFFEQLAGNTSLTYLGLRYAAAGVSVGESEVSMGDVIGNSLVSIFEKNHTLQELGLSMGGIADEVSEALMQTLINPEKATSLACLDLSGVDFSEGVEPVLMLIRANKESLKGLKLRGCIINGEGFAAIAQALLELNTSLRRLDLAGNLIDDVGLLSAVPSLQENTHLQKLNVANNQTTEQGEKAIENILRAKNPQRFTCLDIETKFPRANYKQAFLEHRLTVEENIQRREDEEFEALPAIEKTGQLSDKLVEDKTNFLSKDPDERGVLFDTIEQHINRLTKFDDLLDLLQAIGIGLGKEKAGHADEYLKELRQRQGFLHHGKVHETARSAHVADLVKKRVFTLLKEKNYEITRAEDKACVDILKRNRKRHYKKTPKRLAQYFKMRDKLKQITVLDEFEAKLQNSGQPSEPPAPG